jgi:hypothetical protein
VEAIKVIYADVFLLARGNSVLINKINVLRKLVGEAHTHSQGKTQGSPAS